MHCVNHKFVSSTSCFFENKSIIALATHSSLDGCSNHPKPKNHKICRHTWAKMLRIHILLPYFKSASHFDSYSSSSQQLPRKRWLARRSGGRRASRRCPRRRGLVDWNVVNSGLMRGRGSSIVEESTHFSQGARSSPPLPPRSGKVCVRGFPPHAARNTVDGSARQGSNAQLLLLLFINYTHTYCCCCL